MPKLKLILKGVNVLIVFKLRFYFTLCNSNVKVFAFLFFFLKSEME
jgi:hypothetical protein